MSAQVQPLRLTSKEFFIVGGLLAALGEILFLFKDLPPILNWLPLWIVVTGILVLLVAIRGLYQQYSLDIGILGLAGIGLFLLGGFAVIVGAIAIDVLLLPFVSVVTSGLQHVFSGVQTTLNSTTNGLNTVVTGLNTVVGGINTAVGTVTGAVDSIKNALSSLPHLSSPSLPSIPSLPGLFTWMHHTALTGGSMHGGLTHLTAAASLGASDGPIPSIPPIPPVTVPFSGPDGATGLLSALNLPSIATLSQWGQFFLSAGPLAFGSLLLGLTFLRTKLLSRQIAYMFIAVAAIHLICQFLPFRGETITAALLFVALIWVGYALGNPEMQLFPAQWKLPFPTGWKLQFPWHLQFVTSAAAATVSAHASSVERVAPSSAEVSSSHSEEVSADPDATCPSMPAVRPTSNTAK